MALKVIGSGLGRTGTMSLKLALEKLGFDPCHHMHEVFLHPEEFPAWVEAARGRPNFDVLFARYEAMVDYPGCKLWRALADHYPDAKVLHSTRDPDEWFDSTQATIFAPDGGVSRAPEHMREFMNWVIADFGDRIHDRAFMTDYLRAHDETVRATIPAARLLVYRPGDGWAPLAAFLGVPAPGEDYPKVNSRDEFRARVRASQQQQQEPHSA